MSTLKGKMTGIALTVALVLSMGIFGVGQAFADDPGATTNPGNTTIKLLADDSQISITMPVDLVAAVGPDGTLTYPSTSSFINGSVFPIYVKSYTVANEGIYLLETETDFNGSKASQADTLWSSVKPGAGTAIDIKGTAGTNLTDTAWNMSKAGGATDTLGITYAGKVANLSAVPTTATSAYTITWTVAAGALV